MRGKRKVMRLLLDSGLPEDALSGSARVTMTGRTGVAVEGGHGVIELTAQRIRLKTACGVLVVSGRNLALRSLSEDLAVISGEAVESAAYL